MSKTTIRVSHEVLDVLHELKRAQRLVSLDSAIRFALNMEGVQFMKDRAEEKKRIGRPPLYPLAEILPGGKAYYCVDDGFGNVDQTKVDSIMQAVRRHGRKGNGTYELDQAQHQLVDGTLCVVVRRTDLPPEADEPELEV